MEELLNSASQELVSAIEIFRSHHVAPFFFDFNHIFLQECLPFEARGKIGGHLQTEMPISTRDQLSIDFPFMILTPSGLNHKIIHLLRVNDIPFFIGKSREFSCKVRPSQIKFNFNFD